MADENVPLDQLLTLERTGKGRSALLQQQLAALLQPHEDTHDYSASPGGAAAAGLGNIFRTIGQGIGAANVRKQILESQKAEQANRAALLRAALNDEPAPNPEAAASSITTRGGAMPASPEPRSSWEPPPAMPQGQGALKPDPRLDAIGRMISGEPPGPEEMQAARVKALRRKALTLLESGDADLEKVGKEQLVDLRDAEKWQRERAAHVSDRAAEHAWTRDQATFENTFHHGEGELNRATQIRAAQVQAGLVDARQARAEERTAAREDRADVEKLAKSSASNAQLVEKVGRLSQYLDPKVEIPGMGWVARHTPSVARPLVLSEEERNVQNQFDDLIAAKLQKQSGATVSEQEVERTKRAYGINAGSTPADARNGLARLIADVRAQMQTEEAGYDPAVVSKLRQRGGATTAALPAAAAPPGDGNGSGPRKVPMVAPNGAVVELSPAAASLAEKKGWKRQ